MNNKPEDKVSMLLKVLKLKDSYYGEATLSVGEKKVITRTKEAKTIAEVEEDLRRLVTAFEEKSEGGLRRTRETEFWPCAEECPHIIN